MKNKNSIDSPMRKKTNLKTQLNSFSWLVKVALMLLLVLAVGLISMSIGELNIGLSDLFRILWQPGEEDVLHHQLLTRIRLPRVVLGFIVGGSLSLSGIMLQGIYRNPLVEPYTLGISGGASLGVAAIIVLGLHQSIGPFLLPLAGFAGALLIVFLVYIMSSKGGQINIQSMLLTGVMISFIASSAMMFLMSVTSSENLHGIIFWIMGSLDESNTHLIGWTGGVSLLILILAYLFVQPLNALRLGEEKAKHLGIDTDMAIRLIFILASILAGISVAIAGVIGFVGLIIPHLLRMIFGSDYRILLMGSFLLGGAFVMLSDVVARTIIAPNELPIGVITGLVGGLVFIFLMRSKQYKI
jgi:iron complex transport system permease protein